MNRICILVSLSALGACTDAPLTDAATELAEADADVSGIESDHATLWMAPDGDDPSCTEDAPCRHLSEAWAQAKTFLRGPGKQVTVNIAGGDYFGQWVALDFENWQGKERLGARIKFRGVPQGGAEPTFVGCIAGEDCKGQWRDPNSKYQYQRPFAAISITRARHPDYKEPMVVIEDLHFKHYHNPVELVGSDYVEIGHNRFSKNGGAHAPTAARDCAGDNKPCSRKTWSRLMDSGELPQTTGVIDLSFSNHISIHDNLFRANHNVSSRIAHIHSIYAKFNSRSVRVENNVFRNEQGNIRFRAGSHGAIVRNNRWYGAGNYFRSNGVISGWTSLKDVNETGYKVTGGLVAVENEFYWGDACPRNRSIVPRPVYNSIFPDLPPTRSITGFAGKNLNNHKFECRAARGDNCSDGSGCR